MSLTIQWCDGPRPSVNRPSHTAWFASACCAIATGWRVWIGITAVPSSMRRRDLAHERDRGERRRSRSGPAGTQIEVNPAASAASASARSFATLSRRRPFSGPIIRPIRTWRSFLTARSGVAADPTDPSGRVAMPFSFPRVCLRTISEMGHTRAPNTSQARSKGSTMSRVAVITGAASGMGLAVAQRLAADGDRVALLDLDGDAADRGRRRAAEPRARTRSASRST